MKRIKTILSIVIVSLFLESCARPLHMCKEQAYTMNNQAYDTLSNFKLLKVSDRQLLKARKQSAEMKSKKIFDNQVIVLRFVNEVINKKRFELIDELWSENLIWHGGSAGDVYGRENYKKMLTASVGQSFSNMLLQVKDVIINDDKVVLYFSNSGLNIGDFMGYKASNKTAIWDGIGIYRIENGKIAEAWFTEDILGMFLQLGFIKS